MSGDLPLAQETAIELTVNGQKVAVLMCTPLNLDDLAAGHLFTRGMLTDPSRVLTIGACADKRVMSVVAPGAVMPDSLSLGQVVASGCGSASGLTDVAIERLGRLAPGFSVTLTQLKEWSRAMFKAARLYRLTGGMHCAALALPVGSVEPRGQAAILSTVGENADVPEGAMYFVTREDVGRHNAVDKVIGRGFVDMVEFSSSCIMTSGRIAADMVLKAAAAKVPIIVSRSIPTTAAFEIARSVGITMVGRIGEQNPIVYTNPERIRL